MYDDETSALKNKIAELKDRLQQIYAESFGDINRAKLFEHEYSLFLKACEHVRDERRDCLSRQNAATRAGLSVLLAVAALSFYLFSGNVLMCTFVLLLVGFFACGFMYLLLAEEMKASRASRYCADLEAFFRRHRWSTEENQRLNLPTMPLWEDFRAKWEGDLARRGWGGKAALYSPFRVVITSVDLVALANGLYFFIVHPQEASPAVFAAAGAVWIVAVVAQMLIVGSLLSGVAGVVREAEEDADETSERRTITLSPGTWVNIVRFFFLLDIVAPRAERSRY
ncbi:MAG: hypothetical protein ACM3ON_04750 [Chloroflexota bacterium]